MRILKRHLGCASWVLLAFLAICLLLFGAKRMADARFFKDYDSQMDPKVTIESEDVVDAVGEAFGEDMPRRFKRTAFSFEARPGEEVPCLMAQPLSFEGRLPMIVFLHGSHQDKEFVEEIATPFTEAGFAMVSFDQLMRGNRKVKGKLAEVFAWRERSWKTVNDARRLIDTLVARPDVDPERVYLVGASYGAITGTSVLALDKRIRAGLLIVGGGHISNLVNAPGVRDYLPGGWRVLAKPLIGCLMRPAEPTLRASMIAPTPVLMLNGDRDTVVTPESGKALYESLRDPKEIRWYPCDHPGVRDEDGPVVLQILRDGLQWLLEQDAPLRQPADIPASEGT